MGRSRGGLTTKIHALVDAAGRPILLKLTAGQAHDGRSAMDMLATVGSGQVLLADRGHDADYLRDPLRARSAVANIKPAHDYGAVELVARYSRMDLDDGSILGGRQHDLDIDATSGEVTEHDQDDDDDQDPAVDVTSPMPYAEAIEIALGKEPGRVSGWDLSSDDGRIRYTIDIDRSGGDDVEVEVTASRGATSLVNAHSIKVGTGWRATFDIRPDGEEPVDLRLYLHRGDEVLTETWLYQFHPSEPDRDA